jgi:hypothetical protein
VVCWVETRTRSAFRRSLIGSHAGQEHVARTDFKVLSSKVHQMFGRYHGMVTADDDQVIHLDDLLGFAE